MYIKNIMVKKNNLISNFLKNSLIVLKHNSKNMLQCLGFVK
jgi:hypothetical protein